MAEKRYREFVFDGIGGHRIWDDVKAQSILGEEKFADGLRVWRENFPTRLGQELSVN